MTMPAVHLSGITKRFGAVLANDAIDLDIPAGISRSIASLASTAPNRLVMPDR